MEAIGFVASIGTLIQGADYIRKTLNDYRKGGRDRERLLTEVNNLKTVLDQLKVGDDQARNIGKQEAWLDSVGHLSSKGGILDQIEDVISEIRLKTQRKPGLRGTIIQWTWPFVQEDVDRNVRQMQRLSQNVSLAVQDASLKFTLAIHERVAHVDTVVNKRELRAILEWLSTLNFLEQQRLEFLKAFPGTCEWFLSSPEYNAWKQKQQRVLYCAAIGGAGKTILASVAIDDLRKQMVGQDVGILLLYCKHDRPDTYSTEKLAMALLRQLIQIKKGLIPPDLEELLEKHYYTNDTRPALDEVLKVMNTHLSAFSASFIILDGLDEIQEATREQIITFLMKLDGGPSIMFTSRPVDIIEKIFNPITSDHDFDDDASTDSDEKSSYSWTEDQVEDTQGYDLFGASYDETSSVEDASNDATNDRDFLDHQSQTTSETSSMHDDGQSFQQQPDGPVACSKCGKNIDSLQYHCQKCIGNQSVICVSCYGLGARCISGDRSHDTYVVIQVICLKLDVSARPHAIRTYVRRRTQQSSVLMKFVEGKPGFAEEVETVVSQAAQRMYVSERETIFWIPTDVARFLLAQLHMDALSNPNLLKFSEVRSALRNLPTELYDSYDNAMDRIQGHGKSLLKLLTYALRPLSTQDVEHALGISFETDELLDDEIIPASTLISRCAGLVTLDQNYEVVFSHYTIASYFALRRDDLFGNGHKYMAETCLTYLNLKEFHEGPVIAEDEGAKFDARLRVYPFLEYASTCWGIHAENSNDDDVLELAYEYVMNDQCFNACIQALWFSSDEMAASWHHRSGASPLHLAMHFQYKRLAIQLLRSGMDAEIQDISGMTPLMWAAQAGDLEMTEAIVRMDIPLNTLNNNEENAFHLAILHYHQNVAILLINQTNLDINTPVKGRRGAKNVTPLMLAVENEETEVVQKLLARKDILVNNQDTRGRTAIHRAAIVETPEIVEALIAVPSIDLEPLDELGDSPLVEAATYGVLPALRALLDAGVDINIRQSKLSAMGNALMRAADSDYIAIVSELIKRKIDWNAKDTLDRNAIHSAAINGSVRSLMALLDLPDIDMNAQDIHGNTPVHDAAGGYYGPEALTVLLGKGARIDIRNNRGKTPLDVARSKGLRKNLEILMGKYAEDFGIPRRSLTDTLMEESNLLQAVHQGNEAAVTSFLAAYKQDKTLDIEERDDWLGWSPLQIAVHKGHIRIVKKLHRAGANINVRDKMGRSALHTAIISRRFSVARYLLRNNVDVTGKDKWGSTVMEDAIPSLQALLLEHGVKVTKDLDLKLPLFSAAELGYMRAVQRLVDAGVEVQVKDAYGMSPYERAKQAGKTEMAKYLDQIGRRVPESDVHHLATSTSSSTSIKTTTTETTLVPEPVDVTSLDSSPPGTMETKRNNNLVQTIWLYLKTCIHFILSFFKNVT